MFFNAAAPHPEMAVAKTEVVEKHDYACSMESASAFGEPLDLTARDREAFFNSVLNPPAPNARMLAAARRYREETGR